MSSDPFEQNSNYPAIQYSMFLGSKDNQLVLRAQRPAELAELLRELTESPEGVESVLSEILNGTNTIRSSSMVISNPGHPSPASAPARSAPPAETPQETKPCITPGCGGTMVLVRGFNTQKNKPWARWTCGIVRDHIEWGR
jgi:hypothetical protein